MKQSKKLTKEKAKKIILSPKEVLQAHIQASYNNIIISITDQSGRVITWSSAGKAGFKGAKKSTPYAAQIAANQCATAIQLAGGRKVEALVKGPGFGREAAIKAIQAAGLEVVVIKDVTPVPHNGCRPPKLRRS